MTASSCLTALCRQELQLSWRQGRHTHPLASVHNLLLDPSLAIAHSTGVVAFSVLEADALLCFEFLKENWQNGKLLLRAPDVTITGFGTYGKTLLKSSRKQQLLHTLLINTPGLLSKCREQVPGFASMERTLVEWIFVTCKVKVALHSAHPLRQSASTGSSTAFDLHQDTEDIASVKYTAVVKLSPDKPHEPPSAMHVVGAACDFQYETLAGSGAFFQAGSFHRSVLPLSSEEHTKISFFFVEC